MMSKSKKLLKILMSGGRAGAAMLTSSSSLPACGTDLWLQGSPQFGGSVAMLSTSMMKVFDSNTPSLLPRRAADVSAAYRQLQTRPSLQGLMQQQESLVRGDSYRIPEFCPPWEHKMNPLLSEARIIAKYDWFIRYFGAKLDPRQVHKIVAANTHVFVGGVTQTTSASVVPRLDWAMEYYLLLFVWDDELLYRQLASPLQHCVEMQLAMVLSFPDDRRLQETLEKYLLYHPNFDLESTKSRVAAERAAQIRAMELGQQPGPGSDFHDDGRVTPICSWLLRLLIQSASVMPEEWSLRFAYTLQMSFFAMFQEAVDPEHRREPSVAAYIPQRRKIGCVEPSLITIDYMEDVFVPNKIYYSPIFQQLVNATNDAVCWHNDIWSLAKELVVGQENNLVFLVSKENECTYSEAAEVVTQMVVNKCQEMQLAAAVLRGPEMSAGMTDSEKDAVEKYIACCNAWISITHEFHFQSERFHLVEETAPAVL